MHPTKGLARARATTTPRVCAVLLCATLYPGCGALSSGSDPTSGSGGPDMTSVAGQPPTLSASTSSSTPPPDYRLSFDRLQILVDANNLVQAQSSGGILLRLSSPGGQRGEGWKTVDATGRCCTDYSFTELDQLYSSMPISGQGTIPDGSDIAISWQDFGLLGAQLPAQRFLLVHHHVAPGHGAYTLFRITFPAPQ